MKTNPKADRSLDCLGLFCPEPVFRTRLELDKMEVGETLEVWADDPAAEHDLPSLVKRLGHQMLTNERKDGRFRFVIRKVK